MLFPLTMGSCNTSSLFSPAKDKDFLFKGLTAFNDGNYLQASIHFNDLLDIRKEEYGERSLKCALAQYRIGLARLHHSLVYTFTKAGKNEGLALAWEDLRAAWSIIKEESKDSTVKIHVLTALGDAAYYKGQSNSQYYYHQALDILECLPGSVDYHRANLNFKMGKCLSKISRPVDARSYFEEAESICRQKLRRVLSTGGSADTLTFCEVTSKNLSLVPSVFMHELSEKVGTATLYELQRECEKKLKNLPLQFIPIPIEANCSTRWTHFGVDGRGVKRQFSPGISTEANLPTKKRSDRTFIFKETS